MSIQSPNLRMTALEVLQHQPADPSHPQIQDGIHLRWNPGENKSFPWYGYYLLRRDHIPPNEFRCLHTGWIKPASTNIPYISASVGTLSRNYMLSQYGYWISDQNIRLTDDFPPHQITDNARMVEVDLQGRRFCSFYFNEPTRTVFFYMGFRTHTAITVHYKLFDKTIHTQTIDGDPDQIVPMYYSADAITSVTIDGTNAAVVMMCHIPVALNLYEGWEFIDGIDYPICLPVAHANYPCPNKPNTPAQAANLAISRVVYGDPNKWTQVPAPGDPSHVQRLHELLSTMVQGGPNGPAMNTVAQQYVEADAPDPTAPEALNMPAQKPMDLVLLGALDPSVAQMTGLYALDASALEGRRYDYLIVADHKGLLKPIFDQIGTANGFGPYSKTVARGLQTPDLDGWICFDRTLQPIEALDTPTNPQVYALPGMTVRDEETGLIKNSDARNSAGLTWDLGLNNADLLGPNKAVMYELWRHYYGSQQPAQLAPNTSFESINEHPFVVVEVDQAIEDDNETSSEFPPFRLHTYDNYLQDGWYSYKIRGRGLFGRYSDLSVPASWHQWAPAPNPKPHYYQNPPSNQQLNPFATHLLDLTPPPPPTSTEAVALDHADPFLQKDTAYTEWRLSIENATWFQNLTAAQQNNMIGLRVRWQWTLYHMRQAPNIVHFHLYYHPGYQPPANAANGSNWNNFLLEHDYGSVQREFIRVMGDLNGVDLEGTIADGQGAAINGNQVTLPVGYDLSVIRKGFEHIVLINGNNRGIFRIDAINTATRRLTLEAAPAVGATASWRIGLRVRQYEVFLPIVDGSVLPGGIAGLNPGLSSPDNFVPSLEFPKCYANIGVRAVEQKGPQLVAGNVGASAKIFRVRREKPAPPPPLPPDSDKVFASPADYYGRSYYTYRWAPADFLRTHIYRALDESIFLKDYALRPKNNADPDLTISAEDNSIFPDANIEPAWDALKRQTIANELNGLNATIKDAPSRAAGLAAYRQLSNDALRILAGLPHNKDAFQQITIQPFENDDASITNGLGPNNPDSFVVNPNLKKYIDELPGKASNRYFYRAAFVDRAENISAMNLPTVPIYLPDVQPPKKPVVTKITAGQRSITLQWASQKAKPSMRLLIYGTAEEANTRDLRLMGAPLANLPLGGLIADGGQLDFGAATDVAQVERVYAAADFQPDQDWLSGQTAAAYLAAPAAPVGGVLNGLTANDGTAVVAVYTDSQGALQRTACRQLPRAWTHVNLTGGTVYFYRLVVQKTIELDNAPLQITSAPSPMASGKPYDLTPPTPPTISTIEWVKVNDDGTVFPFDAPNPTAEPRYKAVRLQWTAPDPKLKCLVQFQNSSLSSFSNASGWLPKGHYEYIHKNNLEFLDQQYRLKVINEAGNSNEAFNIANLSSFVTP